MNINKIWGCLLLLVSMGIALVALTMAASIMSGSWISLDTPFLIAWGIMATIGLGVAAAIIGVFGVIGVRMRG